MRGLAGKAKAFFHQLQHPHELRAGEGPGRVDEGGVDAFFRARACAQRVHFGEGAVDIGRDRAGYFGELDGLIIGGVLQMAGKPRGITGLQSRDTHCNRPRTLVPRNIAVAGACEPVRRISRVMACAPGL